MLGTNVMNTYGKTKSHKGPNNITAAWVLDRTFGKYIYRPRCLYCRLQPGRKLIAGLVRILQDLHRTLFPNTEQTLCQNTRLNKTAVARTRTRTKHFAILSSLNTNTNKTAVCRTRTKHIYYTSLSPNKTPNRTSFPNKTPNETGNR